MGTAILDAVVKQKVFLPKEILVLNRSEEKNEILAQKYGVRTTLDPKDLESADMVVLGFKPQQLLEIDFNPKAGAILISLLAGKTFDELQNKFSNTKIVRTMPNLGQFAGAGMTGILFDNGFSDVEKEIVKNVFSAGGKVLELGTEEKLNALTVISGCGPAYFFRFAELLSEQAKSLGFSPEDANVLARQTLIGAAEVIKNSEESLASWREKVTSKGGVTAAGLNGFAEAGLDQVIEKGIQAALKRNEEL
jgi:pyrroline-5-carboxylate reductase